MINKYFFSFLEFPFHLHDGVLCRTCILNIDKVQCMFFFSLLVLKLSDVECEKALPNTGLLRFIPVFF